jgi:hypothetical protein
MLMPMPTPPIPELASLSILSTAGESYDIMLVLPVWGTLPGAGEEKVGRCFEGVLVEGVGVAMFGIVSDSRERGRARSVLGDERRSYRADAGGIILRYRCG